MQWKETQEQASEEPSAFWVPHAPGQVKGLGRPSLGRAPRGRRKGKDEITKGKITIPLSLRASLKDNTCPSKVLRGGTTTVTPALFFSFS